MTVEVSVLDRKGNPVRNLKKEDFRLFEDGKQQEIVTFGEVTDSAGQEVPTSLADKLDGNLNRGKVVLILFDDSHISGRQTQVARDSAEKYVRQSMRLRDLFAVATFGNALKILQDFTYD